MGKFPQNSGFNERSLSMTHFMMRCFSTATFFSTATLKFYCRFYCHFYSHFLVAVEPKNLSTASGSRDQKTVLQPLAVESKTPSTATGSRSGSRTGFEFYCHYQIRLIFKLGSRSVPNKGNGRYRLQVKVG